MHEGPNTRSRHEPQVITQEPKSIGSVAHLMECPSFLKISQLQLKFPSERHRGVSATHDGMSADL